MGILYAFRCDIDRDGRLYAWASLNINTHAVHAQQLESFRLSGSRRSPTDDEARIECPGSSVGVELPLPFASSLRRSSARATLSTRTCGCHLQALGNTAANPNSGPSGFQSENPAGGFFFLADARGDPLSELCRLFVVVVQRL